MLVLVQAGEGEEAHAGVPYSSLKQAFDGELHPDVASGKRSSEEAFVEFTDACEVRVTGAQLGPVL